MNVMQATTGRLYPSAKQARAIARIGGQCRALWNHWLAANQARYEAEGKFAFYSEMSASLPTLRKEEPFVGLPHRCAQLTVHRLDVALRDCGRKSANRKGFPKFKKYIDRNDSFQFVGAELRVEPGRVRLPVLGWIKVRGLRLPTDPRFTVVTVAQDRGGWKIAIQLSGEAPACAFARLPAIGIDLGLSSIVTTSDGAKVAAPRLARSQHKRIRRLEREKSRRRRGSVNRNRTIARLRREHSRIAARRKDFAHKLTTRLIESHAGVAIEKLNVVGLGRTRLARSMADAALGEIKSQFRYKAEWYGREYREMPTFQRSTGVCPGCGLVGPRLHLSVREWTCSGCGAMHDRDVAAAQIILRSAVPVEGRELADSRKKRGLAVRRGPSPKGLGSAGGPPTNSVVERVVGASPSATTETSALDDGMMADEKTGS